MPFIHSGNEITGSRSINPADHIQDNRVLWILWLNQIDDSALLDRNAKLFRLVVDIDQKQVVQNKILDKTVAVKPFTSGS